MHILEGGPRQRPPLPRLPKRLVLFGAMLALGAVAALTALTMSSSAAPSSGIIGRADVRDLPAPLQERLVELANRPSTFEPARAFSEADKPSQLFQYYLLDTKGFQPNVFTSVVPGINDGGFQTAANAANGGLPTIGSVRVVLEPKAGKPTDPNDVRAAIDVFTDISGLFVINNESGWYEAWLIHDLRVPKVAQPGPDGRAQYATITPADAEALKLIGDGNNVPGSIFTVDGTAPKFPSADDHFPDKQSNAIAFPVSNGTFNASQQSDVHAYWEFNPGTDWTFPLYELPATGGIPGTFDAGLQYGVSSLIPGSGPAGVSNDKVAYGDNPDNPRDPDRAEGTTRETRNRFIPSGLANEVLTDVFLRVKSFEPGVELPQRLFDAYAQEIGKVDQNGDGVVSFAEADVNGTSAGLPNTRLYLPATAFNRFAVTREIDDGLLAPRFAPGQRAYVLGGQIATVSPAVNASLPQDADNR
jgi:hypothetical protein